MYLSLSPLRTVIGRIEETEVKISELNDFTKASIVSTGEKIGAFQDTVKSALFEQNRQFEEKQEEVAKSMMGVKGTMENALLANKVGITV